MIMSTGTLKVDATPSTRATVYQLCLAVDKCYQLGPGQKLRIEELGDITIEDLLQIEVKAYSGILTDGHPNFWNTLKNWMDPAFPSGSYESLVLFTTQPFSEHGKLAAWNESKCSRRLEILLEIHKDFEAASANKQLSDPEYKPSKTLKQQRDILADARRPSLVSIIEKITIEASQAKMSALYKKIRNERSFGVLQKNKDAFIAALFGFVCRLDKPTTASWSISQEEFDEACQSLMNTYCSESREFPTAHFDEFEDGDMDSSRTDLFLQKIRDIDHSEFLFDAIREYESTIHTIATEFSDYSVRSKHMVTFKNSVEGILKLRYKTANRRAPGCIQSSQQFYAEMMTCEPPVFKGYDDRHMWFRNGVLHMSMNDENKNYQWKLA